MHMACSGDHTCACEQQVGKKRKKTGRKKIRIKIPSSLAVLGMNGAIGRTLTHCLT